jgi:hypothetical protein
LLAEFAAGLVHLRDAPFGATGHRRLTAMVPGAVDAALTAVAALALDGDWANRLFPPLVLLAALHASRPGRWPGIAALLGDRTLLALLLAVAAAFDLAAPAVMLLALLVIVLDATVFRAKTRITPA